MLFSCLFLSEVPDKGGFNNSVEEQQVGYLVILDFKI